MGRKEKESFRNAVRDLSFGDNFRDVLNVLNEFGYEKIGVHLVLERDEEDLAKRKEIIDNFRTDLSRFVGYIFGEIACEETFREFADIDVLLKMTAYLSSKFTSMLGAYFEERMRKDRKTFTEVHSRERRKEREKNARV